MCDEYVMDERLIAIAPNYIATKTVRFSRTFFNPAKAMAWSSPISRTLHR